MGASKTQYSEDFGNIFGASSVTDLHLTVNDLSDPCLGTPDSLILLALPKKLTRLSVYLKGCYRLSNTDLWNAIRQYKESIEYLDVHRNRNYRGELSEVSNSHFGSLREFKRLERLYIQVEVLFGDQDNLGDSLPPNSKSLNFYFDNRMSISKIFSQQLQNFI